MTISPPKDYRPCALCGTQRPQKKLKAINKYEVDGVTTVETSTFVCADDEAEALQDPNVPLSRFCRNARPPETDPGAGSAVAA